MVFQISPNKEVYSHIFPHHSVPRETWATWPTPVGPTRCSMAGSGSRSKTMAVDSFKVSIRAKFRGQKESCMLSMNQFWEHWPSSQSETMISRTPERLKFGLLGLSISPAPKKNQPAATQVEASAKLSNVALSC